MHRRQFLGMMAGALLPSTRIAAQESATPSPPQHNGRPRPIVLGDGIELIDYRIYPSEDKRRIIGEIWSTRDDMVDSPVVSMTFPDVEERGGFAYAPPFLPVMRPGQSNMIFGVIPDVIDTEEKLATAEFGLCGPVGQGEASDRMRGIDPVITDISTVELHPTWLNVRGIVKNSGTETMMWATVHGMVRDADGRLVGVTAPSRVGHIAAGGQREFFLWASIPNSALADPYLMLNGASEYTVDAVPMPLHSHWNAGCSSLLG